MAAKQSVKIAFLMDAALTLSVWPKLVNSAAGENVALLSVSR
jgi:hypothetical protein